MVLIHMQTLTYLKKSNGSEIKKNRKYKNIYILYNILYNLYKLTANHKQSKHIMF